MISIVIPTYEQKGEGAKYLTILLQSIQHQKITVPYEIIISDNDTSGHILKATDFFKDLPIKYYQNPIRGASENINNAIDLAQYDKVKIMCQDDVFLTNNAIDSFCHALDSHGWVISNSKHLNAEGRVIGQRLTQYIHGNFKENLTGMPSVMAFRKSDIRFNLNLKTVCDMYFYHQLSEKYGHPGVLKQFHIGARFHNASLSRNQPSYHQKDVNWLIRQGKIEGKLPKVVVCVVGFDREHNFKRWEHVWKQCDTAGAELVFIRNGKDRPNVGYDIGAFQDVCRGRVKIPDYDFLIWCTDDVIPMSKTFISDFVDSFGKRTGVVCMQVSDEIAKHIRTTGFCIKKEVAQRLVFPKDPIITKEHCYLFEHRGRNTLLQQLIRMRLNYSQVAPLDNSPLYDMNYWDRNEEARKHKAEKDRMNEHFKIFGDVQNP